MHPDGKGVVITNLEELDAREWLLCVQEQKLLLITCKIIQT
jgi:hypothetical protein